MSKLALFPLLCFCYRRLPDKVFAFEMADFGLLIHSTSPSTHFFSVEGDLFVSGALNQ